MNKKTVVYAVAEVVAGAAIPFVGCFAGFVLFGVCAVLGALALEGVWEEVGE